MRAWQHKLPHAISETYEGPSRQLSATLETDVSRGLALLERRLMALADRHGDCRGQIEEWYATAHRMAWKNLAEVRGTYRDTDVVGDRTVFNIKGNDYRLIVVIRYDTQIIYIKDLPGASGT